MRRTYESYEAQHDGRIGVAGAKGRADVSARDFGESPVHKTNFIAAGRRLASVPANDCLTDPPTPWGKKKKPGDRSLTPLH